MLKWAYIDLHMMYAYINMLLEFEDSIFSVLNEKGWKDI